MYSVVDFKHFSFKKKILVVLLEPLLLRKKFLNIYSYLGLIVSRVLQNCAPFYLSSGSICKNFVSGMKATPLYTTPRKKALATNRKQ